MDTVGGRVKHSRMAKAMTQAELSEATGVEEATISRIESNKARPRQSTAKKIALVLGIAPGWLLVGDDQHEAKKAAA